MRLAFQSRWLVVVWGLRVVGACQKSSRRVSPMPRPLEGVGSRVGSGVGVLMTVAAELSQETMNMRMKENTIVRTAFWFEIVLDKPLSLIGEVYH